MSDKKKGNHALSKEQKLIILRGLAEDETYPEIAREANCHLQTVKNYASRYQVEVEEAAKEFRNHWYNRGFASKNYRIKKLADMTKDLHQSLVDNKYMAEEVKIAGNGSTIRYKVRDISTIQQVRGLMDDIAKEKGERVNKNEITGKDGKPVEIDATVDDVTGLTSDQRVNRLAALLDTARARGVLQASDSGTGAGSLDTPLPES